MERGKQRGHLGYFALYVTYFPQLVAGPIERSDRLLPQLKEKHTFHYEKRSCCNTSYRMGIFLKKLLSQTEPAVMVGTQYSGNLHSYSGIYLFAGIIGFCASDILWFFPLIQISQLVRRNWWALTWWRISRCPYLSKSFHGILEPMAYFAFPPWFRDYLYIPLGGKPNGQKMERCTAIWWLFLLSADFWHGANWDPFFFGGALHGTSIWLVKSLFSEVNQKLKRAG